MDAHQGIESASLEIYLADPQSPQAHTECLKVANSFISSGILLISTSLADPAVNEAYLTLLENYFAQPSTVLARDLRPEVGYQVGVTLENTEKPSCGNGGDAKCLKIIKGLDEAERPIDLGHEGRADPKCRFFWKMSQDRCVEGKMAQGEDDQQDRAEGKVDLHTLRNVVPKGFEDEWEEKMEDWGKRMKNAVEGVAEMLAVGLGLPPSFFREAGKTGSHLLAPTATDLVKFGREGEVFAGFHSDLNFLTIHGRSRYPGLHIWPRNSGKKLQVKVPEGCLLVQAGKQLEWVSGGLIRAGYHEVVCTKETVKVIERTKLEHPERPLIRISSTFFWHLSPDFMLQPIPSLATQAEETYGEQEEYGKMAVAEQVRRELGLIALIA